MDSRRPLIDAELLAIINDTQFFFSDDESIADEDEIIMSSHESNPSDQCSDEDDTNEKYLKLVI